MVCVVVPAARVKARFFKTIQRIHTFAKAEI